MGLQRSLTRRLLGYVPSQPLPLRNFVKIAIGANSRHPPATPLMIPKHARIAVVGNGPVRAEDGPAIDAHDLVVRFNSCGNYGVSGWRCDVLALCNSGQTGRRFAAGRAWNRLAAAIAKELWLMSPKGCEDDYSEHIIPRMAGRPYWSAEPELCDETRGILKQFAASATTHPSSGMIVLAHLRQFMPITVTLFGFTHEGRGNHPWDAERRLVDQWSDWVKRRQT